MLLQNGKLIQKNAYCWCWFESRITGTNRGVRDITVIMVRQINFDIQHFQKISRFFLKPFDFECAHRWRAAEDGTVGQTCLTMGIFFPCGAGAIYAQAGQNSCIQTAEHAGTEILFAVVHN